MVGAEGTPPVVDRMARPLRDLRISVTDRCNFRCPYCMPAEVFGERYNFLPRAELLTFEEIARLARVFADLGAAKLRITGGEPLVRADVEELVALLSHDGRYPDIAMTTNGYLLADKAEALKDAGLTRVTVSLDSLDDEVFGRMNGRGFTSRRVLDGIARAEEVGLAPIKINTVVQRGVNDHTIVDLARRFQGTGRIVRFIEYMDVGNRNQWRSDDVVPAGEIVERIGAEMPLEPIGANYDGEVAERYRYLDGSGEIGVIASVTKPFCGDCTRARLSTDGRLYTCLFGSIGRDLRAPLRDGANDEELAAEIQRTWGRRADRYSELRASVEESGNGSGRPKIEMYQIGG